MSATRRSPNPLYALAVLPVFMLLLVALLVCAVWRFFARPEPVPADWQDRP
jgi:hypothetical protein